MSEAAGSPKTSGVVFAFAAALFGASTPFAKLLSSSAEPRGRLAVLLRQQT